MSLRLLSLLITSCLWLQAGEQKIVRLWPEFRTAESFERIGEYFNAKESTPGSIVLRTQPNQREGYYFLVRLSEPKSIPAGASWSLKVIFPGSSEHKVFTFKLPESDRKAVYELGLTGNDWPNGLTKVSAWRLALLDSTGKEVVSQQSFLWL